MRLSAPSLGLPPSLSTALENIGCRTDADLLSWRSTQDLVRQLPPGTVAIEDLEDHIARVVQALSAHATSGSILLSSASAREAERNSQPFRLHTGLRCLDKVLDGLGGPRIIEISGDKGSGKSTLVMNIVLRHLTAHQGTRVLWIDTTGDFITDSTMGILNRIGGEAASVLGRLELALAFDLETVYDVLENSKHNSSSPQFLINCVVVDCITPLLAPSLAAVSAQGHAMMTAFMRHLRSFAHRYGSTIIVVNNSVGTVGNQPNPMAIFPTARKPALGPSFPFLSDATLWLTREDDEDDEGHLTHTAQVWRSKHTPSRTWCTFKTHNGFLIPS